MLNEQHPDPPGILALSIWLWEENVLSRLGHPSVESRKRQLGHLNHCDMKTKTKSKFLFTTVHEVLVPDSVLRFCKRVKGLQTSTAQLIGEPALQPKPRAGQLGETVTSTASAGLRLGPLGRDLLSSRFSAGHDDALLVVMCRRVCLVRWSLRMKRRSHTEHTNFFSPVWVRRWRESSSERANFFSQPSQWQLNGFSPAGARGESYT